VDITKKDRTELKTFFKANAIPKESEFAAFIDGVLNQKEDGIVKPSGGPLSIQAESPTAGTVSQQRLIHFYQDFTTNLADWSLSLNPRDDQGTAKAGFSINRVNSDGTEVSRLFIDGQTGNIGIGSINPKVKLEVAGQTKLVGAVGINRAPIDNQHLAIQTTTGNIGLNITDSTGITNLLAVFPNGDVIINGGNLGVGSTSPKRRLHVEGNEIHSGGSAAGFSFANRQASGLVEGPANGERWVWYSDQGTARLWSGTDKIYIHTNGDVRVVGSLSGGNTTPGWTLGRGGVNADNWLRLSQQSDGAYHDFAVGALWAGNSVRFNRQDLAEVTPVNTNDNLEQGDVVIIDRESGLRVTRSTQPGDTAVYGVVSSYEQAAMVIGGGGPDAMATTKDRVPIALVGRVRVKVSAENGAIAVGDLLTTSETPGHAMRCGDRPGYAGAILGKALEPLARGIGLITVLVTLQ
jgi:hypothetical protein